MSTSVNDRLAVRAAGVLIAGVGLWRAVNAIVTMLFDLGPVNLSDHGIWPALLIVIGVAFYLFPRRLALWIEVAIAAAAFIAFPLRAVLYAEPNPHQIYLYPTITVLTMAWIGMFMPRWVRFAIFPVAVICLAVGLSDLIDNRALLVEMAVGVGLAAMLVAEVIGQVMSRLNAAHERDERRVDALQELAGSAGALRAEASLDGVASVLASAAQRCFHGEQVLVVLDAGEATLLVRSIGATSTDSDARTLLESTAAVELRPYRGVDATELVFPLEDSRRSVGAVRVRFDEPQDEFMVHVADLFAAQAAPVVEQARLMAALVDDANRDELTGLGNRRYATAMLEALQPGDAVIILDLDHFKRVNDTWGHAAGDEVLREVSTFLVSTLRGSDRIATRPPVARLGGEEFLVVAKQVGYHAMAVAERLIEDWRRTDPVATISAGVAVHLADRSPEATLAAADTALYQAKNDGRDCARLAQPDRPDQPEPT